MLIRIKESSIRRNPDGGRTRTPVQGCASAAFTCEGKIPENLLSEVIITAEARDGSWCSGLIIDPSDWMKFKDVPGINIEIESGVHFVDHFPLPQYLFEYENPLIKCDHCKKKIPVNDIETDYTDEEDEIKFTVCPLCNYRNSFEEITYQNLSEVMFKA